MILITGATGKVGKELVLELLARQGDFKVMLRTAENVRDFKAKGIKAVQGNFERPETYTEALTNVDTIFLLTTPHPDSTAMERKFMAVGKAMGVKRVVRLSAIGANPWAASALLRNHGGSEAQLEESGLEWTILRPTIFMQNLVPFFGPTISQESTLFAPAGDALLPWVDTRDIAAVAATVLTSKGHEGLVYEITGPEALTYTQVAECLSSLLDRQITYVNVPDGAAHQSMVTMGMSPWLAEGMITLYHLFRANGPTSLVLDTVERITGRKPRTLVAYLKEHEVAFKPLQFAEVKHK